MELNTIEITITDDDLRSLVSKYAPGDDAPVSDLTAHIDTDGVRAGGNFQAGFLKGSFEAGVSLAADGRIVIATLTELKALGPVGGMFKGMIMSAVQEKLGDIPGISSDEDALRFDIETLLAGRGLTARLGTLAIGFAPGRLTLQLSGSIDLSNQNA